MIFINCSDFIKKLFKILETPENSTCIKWSPDGKSFEIFNPLEFEEDVLEKNYKHKNLMSFIRQLNKYDFHKIKVNYGPPKLIYKHKYFQKGMPELLEKIQRKKTAKEKTIEISPDPQHTSIESYMMCQSHIIDTIKTISKYFQILIEDVKEIKERINFNNKSSIKDNIEIFLIEDPTIKILQDILTQTNYSITAAVVNENIFSIFKRKEYSIVVLSTNAPYVITIIEEIRCINRLIPIILISEPIPVEKQLEYIKIGVSDILTKPFSPSSIIQIIKKHSIPRRC